MRLRFARGAAAAGLALVLAAPLTARAADEPAKPIAVPFELLPSRHMLVQVTINGKGPYQLIFDTGAPVMLINNKLAKETGVITAKTPKPLFAPFGSAGQFAIKSMELGALKAENVQAVVMDHPTVEAIAGFFKKPIDGIVGFPFFARYRTTVDYQAKELTFVPNGYKPADVMQTMTAALMQSMNRSPGDVKVLAPAGQWGLVVDKGDGDQDDGVDVTAVRPDSAAAAAGLKASDRLLTIDGRWTDSIIDTFRAAGAVKSGQAVTLKVRRGGQELELTLTPRPGL
jgi:membrane-associated protease RseP (regulator of RpoE activity)